MRRHRQERRDERASFGARGDATRYHMRRSCFSIGDDFWIEKARGERVFKVNGKALRVRQTLNFEDLDGRELCKIQERKPRVEDSMEIEGPGGDRIAMVQQAMITPLRERWVVRSATGRISRSRVTCSITSTRSATAGTKVAEVSKQWFRVRDTYGVEIAPGQDDIIVLAVTVAVDVMADGAR